MGGTITTTLADKVATAVGNVRAMVLDDDGNIYSGRLNRTWTESLYRLKRMRDDRYSVEVYGRRGYAPIEVISASNGGKFEIYLRAVATTATVLGILVLRWTRTDSGSYVASKDSKHYKICKGIVSGDDWCILENGVYCGHSAVYLSDAKLIAEHLRIFDAIHGRYQKRAAGAKRSLSESADTSTYE